MDGDPESTTLLLAFFALFLFSTIYLLSVLFSIALIRVRPSSLEDLGERDSKRRRRADLLISRAETYLLSFDFCQVVSVLCIAVAAGNIIPFASNLLSTWFDWSPTISVSVLFAISLLYLLAMIVLAQLMRSIAAAFPEHITLGSSALLLYILAPFQPFFMLLNTFSARLSKAFSLPKYSEREPTMGVEELSDMVRQSREAGEIEDAEGELLEGVIEFADTLVAEVMTPRTDIVHVRNDARLDEIMKAFIEEGFSRLLVIGEDLDDVRGILLAKDLMGLVGKPTSDFDLTSYVRKPVYIYGNKPVSELLKVFRRAAMHIAVVLDEHGGVDGIVTMEDLLEEIVGDIFDEHDSPEEEVDVLKTQSGEFSVDAAMAIDDLNETFSLSLPEGEYDTVAGFLIQQLERIPQEGESLTYDGVCFEVEELDQNRITRIRVKAPLLNGQITSATHQQADFQNSDSKEPKRVLGGG